MSSQRNLDSVFNVDINHEMRESYLQYSMSVIVGRALPDARDGLKPVHRRILFAMKNLNNTHDKPYKKSARVVGDVIGKYHPHGDAAVYDSIVRMAQPFSMRHPLVDGQGNFGSVDGDAPAAARYTEVRMTKLSEKLLEDLDKETVPFVWNYDDTLLIPQVLPSRLPHLLINGSEGIAVGMASRIPPHNLQEVISACVALIDNPLMSDEDLMQIIPGPDFPTAGVIKAHSGLVSAYKTGKGIITVQAECEVREEKGRMLVLVKELPYQVNKARLIESIAELVKARVIEGISDIRDESSREGMRIVIVLKKRENADIILNQLFKHTALRVRFGIIFLALDAAQQPRIFSLKQMLKVFVEHRYQVVTRRLLFDLRRARARAHILEGLSKALDRITEIISTIRSSKDTAQARERLMGHFELSRLQAQAILDMRLQKLTGLEREKIHEELQKCLKEMEKINNILSSQGEIYREVKRELKEMRELFPCERKTRIERSEEDQVTDRDLVPKEDVLVILHEDGGIKRISLQEYRLQKRGGTGLKGRGAEENASPVRQALSVHTHTLLLILTNRGRLYNLDTFLIPPGSRVTKARSIRNVVRLEPKENVQVILPVQDFHKEAHLSLVTKKGLFKKSQLTLFSHLRKVGVIAVDMDEQDQMVEACISFKEEDILIFTKKGYANRFWEGPIRAIGRKARGVRGISLRPGDEVISMENIKVTDRDVYCLTVTRKGFGKRTKLTEYTRRHRGGKGMKAHKVTEKTGDVVGACLVQKPGRQMLVLTNQGQSIRFSCDEVSVVGRSSQGVRLMKLKSGEFVSSVSMINEDTEDFADH